MTVTKKTVIVLTKVVVVCFVLLVLFGKITAKRITCDSFESQKQAQTFFNSDNVQYKSLDRDNDKKACETLK